MLASNMNDLLGFVPLNPIYDAMYVIMYDIVYDLILWLIKFLYYYYLK